MIEEDIVTDFKEFGVSLEEMEEVLKAFARVYNIGWDESKNIIRRKIHFI